MIEIRVEKRACGGAYQSNKCGLPEPLHLGCLGCPAARDRTHLGWLLLWQLGCSPFAKIIPALSGHFRWFRSIGVDQSTKSKSKIDEDLCHDLLKPHLINLLPIALPLDLPLCHPSTCQLLHNVCSHGRCGGCLKAYYKPTCVRVGIPAYTRLKNRSLACWGCPSQLYRGSRSLASSFTSCSRTFFIVPYGMPLESTNTGFFKSVVWLCVLLRRFRGNVASSSVSVIEFFESSSPSESPSVS